MKKIKICKCGHLKEDHKRYCKKCPCSDYLNREFPKISDKISNYILIAVIGFIIFVSILVTSMYYGIDLTEKVEKTRGDIVTPLIIVSLAFFLIIGMYYAYFILRYYQDKRRPSYPSEV